MRSHTCFPESHGEPQHGELRWGCGPSGDKGLVPVAKDSDGTALLPMSLQMLRASTYVWSRIDLSARHWGERTAKV